MRQFSTILAILFLVNANAGTAAAACTKAQAVTIQQFPPLMGGSNSIQPYYCAASPAALSVGDLSPTEWAKRVQVCTTNCSYEPISPTDPRSTLIATSCTPGGQHSTQYYVDVPKFSSNGSNSLVDSCQSNALLPSKGAAPQATPRPIHG